MLREQEEANAARPLNIEEINDRLKIISEEEENARINEELEFENEPRKGILSDQESSAEEGSSGKPTEQTGERRVGVETPWNG